MKPLSLLNVTVYQTSKKDWMATLLDISFAIEKEVEKEREDEEEDEEEEEKEKKIYLCSNSF